MRIALTTIGSRGDIQLYIALGAGLQKVGYSVAILTHPWARDIVEQYGVRHIPVGEDIDIHFHAKEFVENSANNLKGFRFALNFIFDNLRNCHSDFLSNLKDFDLIIGHGIVGKAEADILQKPYITVSIATMGLQKEYWKTKNLIRELGIFLSDKIFGSVFGKPYIQFRKDVNAPPLNNKDKYPYLAIVPLPLFLQKQNPNWKRSTEISGFFFADTPHDYSPPNELINYIGLAEKPILVTFGSMFHNPQQTQQLFSTICDAVLKSKSRAILIMPDLNLNEVSIPEHIFLAKEVPYSWLLNQVDIVVHHFGFGTTAEVLKAGLPSIPIPHIFDQKIRASKIFKLGYSHKPLDIKKINGDALAKAITHLKKNEALKKKCREAGIKISYENGIEKAAELINRYITELKKLT